MTDPKCRDCGRTPDETDFRPSESQRHPTQFRCRECSLDHEFWRRNPGGKRCVCCGVPKGRDDYPITNGRVGRRCKTCAVKPALRDPLMLLDCVRCGMKKQSRLFNNDHLQPSGKNDHCRACRNEMPAMNGSAALDAGGFEDDPRAATADLHGVYRRVSAAEYFGIGGTSAAQAIDDVDMRNGEAK